MRTAYERYLQDIELDKRILEIGPLANPICKKNEANVFYADSLSTQDVKAYYKHDPKIDKDSICDIDFVIHGSYTETFRDVAKFDYILSSHILEHMPRLIDFFLDSVNILNTHGRMYIFLPDCRYCFDHFRSPTSFAELYYIHTQGLKFAPWQVLDGRMSIGLNDPKVIWANKKLFHLLAPAYRGPFAGSKAIFEKALAGEDLRGHYSTFTPSSFLLLLHEMTRAGVLPYKLVRFFPTPSNSFTFGCLLEACPELPSSADVSEREMDRLRQEMVRLVDYEEDLTVTFSGAKVARQQQQIELQNLVFTIDKLADALFEARAARQPRGSSTKYAKL